MSGRCRDCEHYTTLRLEWFGTRFGNGCLLTRTPRDAEPSDPPRDGMASDAGDFVHTGPDFGCIHWAAKK